LVSNSPDDFPPSVSKPRDGGAVAVGCGVDRGVATGRGATVGAGVGFGVGVGVG
jgi:hypothetical protein